MRYIFLYRILLTNNLKKIKCVFLFTLKSTTGTYKLAQLNTIL